MLVGTCAALGLPGTWAVSRLPASANSIGSTQATIAQLQSQITRSAARIHRLTDTYGQAQLQATNLAQQIQANEAEAHSLAKKVAASRRAIRNEAIASYTGSTPDAILAAARTLRGLPQVQSEYLDVADNNLGNRVAQLRLQRLQLADVRTTLKGEQRASARAIRQAATARRQALRQAAREQIELDQDQSRLTALEAAAQAQATAAAEARSRASTPSQGLGTGLVKSVASQVTTSSGGSGEAGGVWLALRECESGDNYQENTGNGFYGAYQFSESTWLAIGYSGYPYQAAPAVQDAAAKKLQAMSGWGQWPACSAELGLT